MLIKGLPKLIRVLTDFKKEIENSLDHNANNHSDNERLTDAWICVDATLSELRQLNIYHPKESHHEI